jgi:ATP-dependent DNA ligase
MFGRTGTHFFAFDLLWLGKTDLRPHPLERRKSILQELLGAGEVVRYCDHVDGFGKAFYELVRGSGLEGMVAKRRRSVYRGGVTGDWLKVKCIRTHKFVVGGWIPGSGRCRAIEALLLGEFIGGALRYVGKVESGFDARSLRAIGDALKMQVGRPSTKRFLNPMRSSAARTFVSQWSLSTSLRPAFCGARFSAGSHFSESGRSPPSAASRVART